MKLTLSRRLYGLGAMTPVFTNRTRGQSQWWCRSCREIAHVFSSAGPTVRITDLHLTMAPTALNKWGTTPSSWDRLERI